MTVELMRGSAPPTTLQSYDDFVGKAARSRRMPLEDMQRRAQGRVWTGVEAKELVSLSSLHRCCHRCKRSVLMRSSVLCVSSLGVNWACDLLRIITTG